MTCCESDRAARRDEVLDVLSHELRRGVIDYFENETDDDACEMQRVVQYVTERTPGESAESVRVKLIHSHLPKLEAKGWLDFDRRSETIRYHGHEAAEETLDEVIGLFTDGDE